MTLEKTQLSSRYSELMIEYVKYRDEATLVDIDKLAMEMVQSNLPLEEIGEMHHAAIGECMGSLEFNEDRNHLAAQPLMQLLMSYSIVFRQLTASQEKAQAL